MYENSIKTYIKEYAWSFSWMFFFSPSFLSLSLYWDGAQGLKIPSRQVLEVEDAGWGCVLYWENLGDWGKLQVDYDRASNLVFFCLMSTYSHGSFLSHRLNFGLKKQNEELNDGIAFYNKGFYFFKPLFWLSNWVACKSTAGRKFKISSTVFGII